MLERLLYKMLSRGDSILTAIIPIGNWKNIERGLFLWLPEVINYPINVEIIYDGIEDRNFKTLTEKVNEIKSIKIAVQCGKYEGPGRARNVGIEKVDTEWVVFWDADDLPILHETIAEIEEELSNGIDLICGNYSIKDGESGATLYTSRLNRSLNDNLNAIGTQPGIWRMLFRQKLIGNTRFLDKKMGEDQEFFLKILIKNPKIKFSERKIYNYFTNIEGQLTSNKLNSNYLNSIELEFRKLIPEIPEALIKVALLMFFQINASIIRTSNIVKAVIQILKINKWLLMNGYLFKFIALLPVIVSEKRKRSA